MEEKENCAVLMKLRRNINQTFEEDEQAICISYEENQQRPQEEGKAGYKKRNEVNSIERFAEILGFITGIAAIELLYRLALGHSPIIDFLQALSQIQ